ncbi:MAG: aminotransferase class I/II-fold pyridoxal phosphate-dependent enzyme [Candidatus Korarchaeum sp.]|nr:aminotransferase class I/II-fold pyridoxal phosphate-dependent enzyme [Candidatus Korarchaeum sp.]MDW8034938.1 aminotransferase class I/II-fold pyridoxal phosphate-dependent enzyme [Candidatus Korarchaeum sp.]
MREVSMRVKPFLVERYMSAYEHLAKFNIAETCVAPFKLGELLSLIGRKDLLEELKDLTLDYGYTEGLHELRERVARLYRKVDPGNVLITRGAIEANFQVFYTLLEPGDKVISIFPAYQQLYSAPESFGAHVELLELREENSWLPDLSELEEMIDDSTKLVVMNNPHNPTGSVIDEATIRRIIDIVESSNSYLLFDESYHGLFLDPSFSVPSAADLSERVVVTRSFSKPLSLTGLRLGWIATRDRELVEELKLRRDYMAISNSVLVEKIAAAAMENVERIYERSLQILRRNLSILRELVESRDYLSWVLPKAGSVAFPRYDLDMGSEELAIRLLKEEGVFLVPGSCFGIENHFRIGFGARPDVFEEGVRRLGVFLNNLTS